MTARDLIVAYNFPPFNDASAVTVAKRMVASGARADVVSMDLSPIRKRDETLAAIVAPFVEKHHLIDGGRVLFTSWDSMRDFVERGFQAIEKDLDKYETVYSRSLWMHSHFLAAYIKAKRPEIQWVAEFSDPSLWGTDGTRRRSTGVGDDAISEAMISGLPADFKEFLRAERSVIEWSQFVPFLAGDTVVFTNDQQKQVMLGDLPESLREVAEAKSLISPHPTLPPEYYGDQSLLSERETSKRDGFKLAYFGTFYPNRGGGELLEAWSTLPADVQKSVTLDVFAGDAEPLLRSAEALGLSGQISILPPLPFLDFLKRTAEYDALLVSDTSTSPFGVASPYLPSKVSDYLGSATPTAAICIPGSPLDQADVQWKARVGNLSSIVTMLREMAGATAPSREPLADFTVDELRA